jgi:hypothetical protein
MHLSSTSHTSQNYFKDIKIPSKTYNWTTQQKNGRTYQYFNSVATTDCSIRKHTAQEQEREQRQITVQIPEHRLFTYIMAHGYAVQHITHSMVLASTAPHQNPHIYTDVKLLPNPIMMGMQAYCWTPASSFTSYHMYTFRMWVSAFRNGVLWFLSVASIGQVYVFTVL